MKRSAALRRMFADLEVEVRQDAAATCPNEAAANEAAKRRLVAIGGLFDRIMRTDAAEILNDGHADAQGALFFARQLEFVMREVYREEFDDLPFANGEIIPFDTEIPENARTFLYYLYTGLGIARFINSYARGNLPLVTMEAAQKTGRVQPFGNAYAWSTQDIRDASFTGMPLSTELGSWAKRAHEELLNDTIAWGREDLGLPGLLNHPNVTVSDSPANGSASSTFWSAKSVDNILADIFTLITTPTRLTRGREKVNMVLLPLSEMLLISTLRMGTGDGTLTVLGYVQAAYPGVQFKTVEELSASGSGGNLSTDSAYAFTSGDPKRARAVAPIMFRQYPVQQDDLMYKVPCESTTGGVIMPRPLAAHRMDGIGQS